MRGKRKENELISNEVKIKMNGVIPEMEFNTEA